MDLADHACHADPLVCADGCHEEGIGRFEKILEVRNDGDVDRDLLCGLVGSSDFTSAL